MSSFCAPRFAAHHVGAWHRRRCVDLVLRFDFDGAWHRPAPSLRLADFIAPISQPRSPRLLAAGGRGDQPSPAGGRVAADPTFRIGKTAAPGHGHNRCRRQVATPRSWAPHVGARHRRRCVDLVLRFDFDGAWHRPARSQWAWSRHARSSRPFMIREGGWERSTFNVQRSTLVNRTPAHRAPPRPGWVEDYRFSSSSTSWYLSC